MPDGSRSAFVDGRQWAWDATSIHLAETCLRKYYYRIIEGWTRPEKSVHLLFGGWYAKALEHYYKYRAEGKDSAEALREVVRETLIATWEVHIIHAGDEDEWVFADTIDRKMPGQVHEIEGRPWQSDHNAKTRETLIRSIIWYVDQFEDEAIHVVHLANGKPAVELSFTIEANDDLVLCGHIDRVVQYNNDYYIMDQKTTGSTINQRYFDQFNPHTQMSLYTLAGQIIYDMPVKGVIIDAAQIAVGFTRFERGFTFRTKSQLDEWIKGAMYYIDRVREAHETGHWPMNTNACGDYGGCEFRQICSRSPEHRGQFLKGDFIKGERWDPLKVR